MGRFQDDSAELARRLEDEIEGVISEYWPAWVKTRVKSQDVALLTPRLKGKNKRPTSSFTVNLSGDRRGQWYRFSQARGGGAPSLLYYGKHGGVPSRDRKRVVQGKGVSRRVERGGRRLLNKKTKKH